MNREVEELRKKIKEHEERIRTIEGLINSKESIKEIKEVKCPNNLLVDAEIDKHDLAHVIYFDEKNFKIVCPIEGKTGIKQFKAAIIILCFYYYCKNTDKITALELGKIFKKSNVSKSNLSRTLQKKEYQKFIIPDGVPGSHEFSYIISNPLGIEKGLEIIRELVFQEQI
ncbi:hypothetical protein [Methanobacterium formicicum]|uniref:hypothetical protein n=1 Tax=Methanobacterium formicicum TaxID=2162 RepID=UPI0024125713|nr:hypothetical protein [Methanobacterium formicicum]MDG3546623.1 hypothetical protein [Methanobacterium formicicum]